jgi:tripartite-type tricarboxylate transporter receptor subunit TctC
MNGLVKRLGVLVLLALCTQTAGAQAVYPNRPIKLIVPFPAGGGIEAVGGSAADFTQKIRREHHDPVNKSKPHCVKSHLN